MRSATIWQTLLAVVTGLVVFGPLIMAAFIPFALLDFVQRSGGGWSGEGLSFYMVGTQWGFAALGAVFIPHYVFKLSSPAGVAWTLLILVALAMAFLGVSSLINGDPLSFNEWAKFISIPVGTGVGGFAGVRAVRRRWPMAVAPAEGTLK